MRWLPYRYLPAPAHAFIPERQGPPILGDMKKRITLGHAVRSDGQLAPVGPTLFDLRQILHFTAGMGAGKSRLLANIFLQIVADGLFLIDGKGDDAGNLIDTVLGLIRLEDEARIVILDITDAEWPIGLNPLAGVRSRVWWWPSRCFSGTRC